MVHIFLYYNFIENFFSLYELVFNKKDDWLERSIVERNSY